MTIFNRRSFMIATTMLGAALALPATAEARSVNFTVSGYNKLVKSGKPFLLAVHTEWCSTCAAQKRVLRKLKNKGAPYSGMTTLNMDWDKYRGSKIGKQLRIPRRSTLIMYGKGKEVGRIIAGTSPSSIKRLVDKGVN